MRNAYKMIKNKKMRGIYIIDTIFIVTFVIRIKY